MENQSLFEIQKEEYSSLRKEVGDCLAELVRLERNCVIAAASVYTWVSTTKPESEFSYIAWLMPFLLALFGAFRSYTIGEHINLLGFYIKEIEKVVFNKEGVNIQGWEHFLSERCTAKTIGLRVIFWGVFLILTLFISMNGWCKVSNQCSDKKESFAKPDATLSGGLINLNNNGYDPTKTSASPTSPTSQAAQTSTSPQSDMKGGFIETLANVVLKAIETAKKESPNEASLATMAANEFVKGFSGKTGEAMVERKAPSRPPVTTQLPAASCDFLIRSGYGGYIEMASAY